MSSLIQRDKIEARKKGMFAAGAWTATALLFMGGAPFLAAAGAVGSFYLTKRWFLFRAKRGMRF